MSWELFKSLFRQTLTDPRGAGARVIALNLSSRVLWMALGLTSALLSLLVSASFHGMPLPPDELGQIIRMSPAYHSPLIFALLNWGQAVVLVFVLHWIGRKLGGTGTLADMLAAMIWLQVMTLSVSVLLFLTGLILPFVGLLAMLIAAVWMVWVTIALVDAGNRFDNMFKALGVWLLAIFAFAVGMSFLSATIGWLARGGM